MKFYICEHCKNIVIKITDHQVPVYCCGQKMKELVANTFEASTEKHKPLVHIENQMVEVSVGSHLHPMTPEHLIEWVVLETNKGYTVHSFNAQQAPITSFVLLDGEKVQAVYAYCNLHGLWKMEM